MKRQARFLLLLPLALLLWLAGCDDLGTDESTALQRDPIDLPDPIERDLDAILDGDTLRVLTQYNSTSYFLYRGQAMGYEYDLLKMFADEHDLHLQMIVERDRDSLYYKLNEGRGDLVAARVVPMAADTNQILFSRTLYETRPMLVQQEPGEPDPNLPDTAEEIIEAGNAAFDTTFVSSAPQLPDSVEVAARLVTRPGQLQGEEVYIPGSSPYEDRLIEISDSVTGDVVVVELSGKISEEALIRTVAAGGLEYTVAPENVARLKESYFTNIAVVPSLDEPHRVSFAVRRNAPALKAALDAFIEGNPGLRQNLYAKYFKDRKGYRERVESEYLTSRTGRLSDYDALLKKYAPEIDWDWRLLASQTYQESRFKPRARSWAGAAGLLQLMPPTAREFGVRDVYDPEENVAGAVRFLEWLTNYWDDKIPDPDERRKFILASYNTGHGHVEDARRLTQKHGGDTTEWEDVAYWLLQKSKRSVYTDPVVKYGFSRGLEPVMYVSHILDRYDHYRQFVDPGDQVAAREAQNAPPAGSDGDH